ncbi:MAG TPA: FAD-binding and (Fe-S)-binding domain-containing protein [Candidatus Desulfaltia sp.]|nr:FAD-binding and (Fe-S)-binding domain-containing protein [Candidatus Desulfaltia sp.]
MSRLNRNDRKWLEGKFGDRANFNPTERVLYGHDIAAIPSLFKPLVGRTVPDAVVQPETEEELRELIRWANGRRISLVPRGKGSSGYGGLIPIRQGLVVDFFRMKDVLSVDVPNETVTVQAGITWEQLDRALDPHGLTLRLYPTSYPSSSAGGWLAQGGAGIGSYAYGWFMDNVISARVVLPDGEIKEFTGKDLELISDAEGTTGVISQVTVQVMKREELGLTAIACPDAHRLTTVFQEFIARALPLWSVVFINPRMAEMKNRAPVRMHLGHPAEHKVILPAAYIAVLAYRAADRDKVVSQLPDILHDCQGVILSQEIAEHEWENRFKLMVVKRLGPSLVPAEIVVPLENLGKVMEEIEHRINQPIVKEGVIIRTGRDGKPEAVILGFIPSDQRKFSYNFVFGLVLSIIKIAEKYGGRPYSTGLYFVRKAKKILGEDRALRVKAFQKKVDRKRILNPGKVVQPNLVSRALGVARLFEPLVRPFGNIVVAQVGERIAAKPIRGIPADVAWYAYACSQCGYCVDECDQFYGRGWESQSPRGKWYWLREFLEGRAEWDQKMVDTILVCTTCELCNLRCSASLPIEPSWMKLRGKLIHEDKRMTFPPFEMMAAALQSEGNIWAGYRKDRTRWFPEDLKSKHGPSRKSQNVYFGGCTVSYVENDIGQAAVTLLDAAGVDFAYLGNVENCCGTPMLVAGKWEIFAENMKRNIAAVKAAGADTVISSCPACDMMWRNVYPDWAKTLGIDYGITAKHYSEVVSEKIKDGSFKFSHPVMKRVTWHDSCHIGRVSGVYEPPRDVIKAIPGVEFVEMTHHHDEAHCCGSVLTLLKDPLVAHDVGETRLEEGTAVKAETVLALCPCCEFQLRVSKEKKNTPIEVRDLAAFACEGLDRKFADPSPEVSRQWKVFEGMIALMTPQGFADLMDTMWPELLKAMPLGMGGMMKGIGKLGPLGGAMFALMKPVFPVLFPRLLPGMMPKVMPTMLERVGAMIPMPDYMAEQMPELMPKVMDNLMPHMLPDVVPLVVPKMVAYLRDRA